jgi:sulfatase maturation enzyme AslB (radical SAM superfamily)
MAESLYCALASNSLSFGSAGGSRPCCAVDTHFWKERGHLLANYDNKLLPWFNNDNMVELRRKLLAGQWDPICNMCKVRESHGQASTRQIFNKTLSDLEEKIGKPLRDDSEVAQDLSKIFLLDITVGNKCNSACLMCNESASTLWAKEQETITGKKMTWLDPNWFSEQHVPALIDHLPNLSAIQFVGGEPTISDAHIALLKRLIAQGRSKEISLGYVTNLTGVSDELLELWSHFGTKHITISVDGVGPVNEYIRYPFSWNKVSSQIEALKNIADKHGNYYIGLSHTVTLLNLTTIDSLLNWWEDQVDSSPSIQKTLPHIQCVNNPDYLNPLYMPKEMKEVARESLNRVIQMAIDRNLGDKYTPVINNIINTILDKEVNEDLQKVRWLQMQHFIMPLDKLRNRNIFDYLPYMKQYWIN